MLDLIYLLDMKSAVVRLYDAAQPLAIRTLGCVLIEYPPWLVLPFETSCATDLITV